MVNTLTKTLPEFLISLANFSKLSRVRSSPSSRQGKDSQN